MGSSRDPSAQTSPGPRCPPWDGLCSPGIGTQHVSRQGASPAGTSMGPLITSSLPAVPHPWLGLPPAQPHEGAAQALWVRKRNNLVSKLGSDMIVAEPQKLSGQTPQKLGKLLSRAQ